ncbi:MAG: nucleotidyltransferase domain-containing protein [Fusobacteriaceae bacterium]
MKNIGLDEKIIKQILEVLSREEKIVRAIIFGSRAKGNFKYNSDIDVALDSNGEMDFLELAKISSELEELPTPYKFDVLDYNNIENQDLKKHIDRVGIIIYEKTFKQI